MFKIGKLLFLFMLFASNIHAQTGKNDSLKNDSLGLNNKTIYNNQAFFSVTGEIVFRTLTMNPKPYYTTFNFSLDTNSGFNLTQRISVWKSINKLSFNISYSISSENIEYHFNDVRDNDPSKIRNFNFRQVMSIHTIGAKMGYRIKLQQEVGMFKKLYKSTYPYIIFALGFNASTVTAFYRDIDSKVYNINTGQTSPYSLLTTADYKLSYYPTASIYYQLLSKNFSLEYGLEINRLPLPLLKDDLIHYHPKILQISFNMGAGFCL